MRYQGRITDWNDERGFGFITTNGDGPRVFVHIKSFANRSHRPVRNQLVTYELTFDERNRPQASSVSLVAVRRPVEKSPTARSGFWAVLLPIIFFGFILACVMQGRLHSAILLIYGVASCIAFMAYAFDKAAAKQGNWRTKESTLHLVGLLGGWPGAMVAQSMFRHKTKKMSFRAVYCVTVLLNCSGLVWLLSRHCSSALTALGPALVFC